MDPYNSAILGFILLTLAIATIALFIAIVAYNDATDSVEDGFVPVKINGRYVNSGMVQGDGTINYRDTIQARDNSLIIGNIKLSNGGNQMLIKDESNQRESIIVMSDILEEGSTTAYHWKFGPIAETPARIPPVEEFVGLDFQYSVLSPANILVTIFTINSTKFTSGVNIQTRVNSFTNDPPVSDYQRATGNLIELIPGINSIEFESGLFFEEGEELFVSIYTESGQNLGLLGQTVNDEFVLSVSFLARTAERILILDTTELADSAVAIYDVYVKAGGADVDILNENTPDGKPTSPFLNIQDAIGAVPSGGTIFIVGTIVITEPIVIDRNKSIRFVGAEDTTIGYETFDNTTGDIFSISPGTTETSSYIFEIMNFSNCGGSAINVDRCLSVSIRHVTFTNIGWNGLGLSLTAPETGSTLGYDSSQVDLQTFGSSENVADGSCCMKITSSIIVSLDDVTVTNVNEGVHLEDCGNFGGIVGIRNGYFNGCIGTAVTFGSLTGTLTGGCRNILFNSNVFSAGGDVSIRVIGCIYTIISNAAFKSGWGAGIVIEKSFDTRLIRMVMDYYNRSPYTAVGLDTDTNSSVFLKDSEASSDGDFLMTINSCTFAHFDNIEPSAGNSKYGIQIGEVSIMDDINRSFIDIHQCSFQSLDIAIVLDVDSITNPISGERAIDLALVDVSCTDMNTKNVLNNDGGNYFESPFTSHYTRLDAIDASNDATSTSIIIQPGDTFNINSLHAFEEKGRITIVMVDTSHLQYSCIDHTLVTIDGVLVGGTIADVINALNVVFTSGGTPSGQVPVITSVLSLNVQENDPINYILTADHLAGVYWNDLPTGLAPLVGDNRELLGAIDTANVYVVPVTVTNAFGVDTQDLTITVTALPYVNAKSVRYYLIGGGFTQVDDTTSSFPLYRAGDGTGASDAWSVSMWVYRLINSNMYVFDYGPGGGANDDRIRLQGRNSDKMRLNIGDNNDFRIETSGGFTPNAWHHIVVTYDGSSTDTGSFNQFKIYIDDVEYSVGEGNVSTAGGGFDGSYDTDSSFRLGRSLSGGNGFTGWIDEVSVYDYVLSAANVTTLYNTGNGGIDLPDGGVIPTNWWRMGDGDIFPTLTDHAGSLTMTMYNMISTDIQNNVPP